MLLAHNVPNTRKPLHATLAALLASLFAVSAWAATPSLTVGTASGQAGATVSLPVNFDPGTASITDMQFDLTLPAAISTVSVTPGSAMTSANVNVGTALLAGNTWRFLLTGNSTNPIGVGTPLLTAQVLIAAGTPPAPLSVSISNVLFSDVTGHQVANGTLTGGTVTVLPPAAPVITSAGTASGVVGTAITAYQIAATNTPASFGASSLPPGLSVNTGTGRITGTPTSVGTFNATISATNAGGTGSAVLVFTISAAPPLPPVITSAGTASGIVGTAITAYQITATNSPASFGASGLPPGLSVNTGTGLISGTPTSVGTFNATISATNASGTGSATLTFTITATPPPAPVITSAGTASGVVGTAITAYQITATNSPASFGASSLPPGLSVNTGTGLISGTPTSAGTFNANVSATNAGGTGNKSVVFTITTPPPPAPVITSPLAAAGVLNVAFIPYQITASNNPASFGTAGLPPGLLASAGGLITGTPTTLGTFSATISATNAGGTGSATLTITITAAPPPAPVITSAGTVSGTVGNPITPYQITATNNPVSYGAAGLPSGLSMSALGLISGTPTLAGTTNVTVNATNAGGTGSKTVVFTVTATGATLPPPVLNLPRELSVRAQITVGYPSGYTIDQFNWSLTQVSALPFSTSASGYEPGAAGASFFTVSKTADLAPRHLDAGQYVIRVSATDNHGNTSPESQATVNLMEENLTSVHVYPNPWKSDRHAGRLVVFSSLPADTTLKIFSVSGHLVKDFGRVTGGTSWNLTNDSGDPVASGIYVYLAVSGGQQTRGKLAVIR